MNTIPSIFNARQINRTVLGGTERPAKITMPVTCIVLMRSGSTFRSRVLENVLSCGFESVITVEQKSKSCNTDQLSRLFPQVKCIVALDDVTPGDMMNIAMAETQSPYALVINDELCSEPISFTSSLAKRLIALNQYCVVPRLASESMQMLPVNYIPGANKSVFEVTVSPLVSDGCPTLYPFDFAGFYDCKKYISLGGADYTITTPYWQNIDLSMRAWRWGERITIASSFQLAYAADIPSEDQTADLSYLRFYLKNLLPVFRTDHAQIPSSSFFAFKRRSSCGISESIRQFSDAQKWTLQNKYRFKTDAVGLINNWGKSE